MDTETVREWYQSRLDIADAVVSEFGDGGQSDAEIFLCCALSALAARIWPKESDRLRYIQLLVDFAPDRAEVARISVPKLQAKLMAVGDTASAERLESHFLENLEGRILVGAEVDQSEETLTRLLPSVSSKFLRESSYAGIIYIDLRCGLVHEYSLGPNMTGFGLSRRRDVPSYVNLAEVEFPDEDAQSTHEVSVDELDIDSMTLASRRCLYLPYPYIRNLATGVAESVFAYWENALEWERRRPGIWWIEGDSPGQAKDRKSRCVA